MWKQDWNTVSIGRITRAFLSQIVVPIILPITFHTSRDTMLQIYQAQHLQSVFKLGQTVNQVFLWALHYTSLQLQTSSILDSFSTHHWLVEENSFSLNVPLQISSRLSAALKIIRYETVQFLKPIHLLELFFQK